MVEPKEIVFGSKLLPSMLFSLVAQFVDVHEIYKLEQVCRVWHGVMNTNIGQIIWRLASIYQEWSSVLINSETCWKRQFRTCYQIEKNYLSGKCTQGFLQHGDGVLGLKLRNNIIASGGQDHMIKLWDLHSAQKLGDLKGHSNLVGSLTFTETHDDILLSGSNDSLIKIWDINTFQCRQTLHGHVRGVRELLVSNRHLLSSSSDTTIKEWDIESSGSMQTLQTLRGHTDQVWVIFMNSNKLLLSGSADTYVKWWDLESGQCIKSIKQDGTPYNLYADEKKLICAGYPMQVVMWDLVADKKICEVRPHEGKIIRSLLVNPLNPKLLFSSGYDSTVQLSILSNKGGEPSLKWNGLLTEHKDKVDRMDFANDTLISGDQSGEIRISIFKEGKKRGIPQKRSS